MGDLKSRKAIIAKGVLFLLLGFLSAGILVSRAPDWPIVVLLIITIWAFCRFYYFAFYVIQHYVDPEFRFSGLWDFARYWLQKASKSADN